MEQCWNSEAGETRDPRENPPTSGIVRHDSHLRKSGSDLAGDRTSLTAQPPRPLLRESLSIAHTCSTRMRSDRLGTDVPAKYQRMFSYGRPRTTKTWAGCQAKQVRSFVIELNKFIHLHIGERRCNVLLSSDAILLERAAGVRGISGCYSASVLQSTPCHGRVIKCNHTNDAANNQGKSVAPRVTGNGTSPRKSAVQRQRPARFPHVQTPPPQPSLDGNRTRLATLGGEKSNHYYAATPPNDKREKLARGSHGLSNISLRRLGRKQLREREREREVSASGGAWCQHDTPRLQLKRPRARAYLAKHRVRSRATRGKFHSECDPTSRRCECCSTSAIYPFIFVTPRGAAGAERLACSPPTMANRVQYQAWLLADFRKWDSCRTMPMVGGYPRRSTVPSALSFRRCSILSSITLIGYQDLVVKEQPKSLPSLFNHYVCYHNPREQSVVNSRSKSLREAQDQGIAGHIDCIEEPSRHSPGVISGYHGEKSSGWSGQELSETSMSLAIQLFLEQIIDGPVDDAVASVEELYDTSAVAVSNILEDPGNFGGHIGTSAADADDVTEEE
ncbi:hypothetical protein PR048_018107 [Dryococelus australis]|uniref:Uncharacterized protein n=1 Tax=Dryococelus australis TaxID=614101 RepID=A0ABQ9HBH9_9NEOP|nr:hypothetical protein PR048_018107 [Dryococelus australis]